jgi:plastocyanin
MRTAEKFVWTLSTAASLALLLAACGGSSTAPSGGGSGGNGGSGGGSTGTTITISNNTVSPKNITVAQGTQVTFTNSDNRNHDMFSNPHPAHTDCPEINQVGFIAVGQSKQTGNLNTVRTCGYHDHNLNTVESLQGTITITAR